MKYSLSSRQSSEILQQADEIRVAYADRESILDYESFGLQDKEIVIMISFNDTDIDWDFLHMLHDKFHITLCVDQLSLSEKIKQIGMKFYWSFRVGSYYDLNGLLGLGVSQIILGEPLTFDLDNVLRITKDKVLLRMVPNVAFSSYLLHVNGIHGTYVRPEDIDAYEPYVDIMQFAEVNLTQERRLFQVYHDDKNWPGNLNILITNLGVDVDNRAFPDEFKSRLNCGQVCQKNGTCHLCDNIFRYVQMVDRSRFDWDYTNHTWKSVDK